MAYDGIFRSEAALVARAGQPLTDAVAAVAAEKGLDVPAPGEVFTHPLIDWPLGVSVPVEVSELQGPMAENSASTTSDLTRWVTCSARDADPEALHEQLKVYLTALVRAFGGVRAADGTWYMTIGNIDAAPPTTGGRDQTFSGAVAVEVTVSIADTRE